MKFLESMSHRATASPQRVAFAEGDDEVIMRAAAHVAQHAQAVSVLVGDESKLRALATDRGIDAALFEFADTADATDTEDLVGRYVQQPDVLLGAKGVARRATDSLFRCLFMQSVGDVDITFAGITSSTGDVIAAAQTVIGLADGIDTPSSVGIFDVPGYEGSQGSLLAFGDSAVCVNPTAEELASIAISCCDTVSALTGWQPRCALLSYSTCGSADGDLVDKVVRARDVAHQRRPDLRIDGEFQLDAALNPRTATRKMPRPSEVAGKANIIVWPDLNAGNIGVKLVQHFAGANAYGPVLQGFKKIVCDCSRGAPVSEIVGNILISCVRSQASRTGTRS